MNLLGPLLAALLLVLSAGTAAKYDPPSVVQPEVSPVIKAKLNDTIKITCPVRATPVPFLEWRKDQELVSELTMVRYNLNAKGSVLQIRRVECSDQGMFSCRGTNGYGSQEVSFQFIVTDGSGNEVCQMSPEEIGSFPKILQTLPKKTKNHILQPAGSHVKLKCIADGTPEPRIIWLKNGREIKESKEKNAKPLIRSSLVSPVMDDEYSDDAGHTEAVRSTLQAGDLTAEDSGTYTCRAINSIGFDERHFYLEVIELAVPQLPEVHADHPCNTTAVRGEQSMLTCKVKSDFPVDVYWLKRLERSRLEKLELSEQPNDTGLLVPNKTITFENNVYQILPSDGVVRISEGSYISKLGFQNPVEADSGFYVCLALNKIGMNFRGAYFYVAAPSRLLEDYLPKSAGPSPEEPSNLLTIAVICSVLAAIVISVTVICIMWARNSRKAHAPDYLKPAGGASAPRATPDSQTSSSNKQTQSTSLGSSETGAAPLIPHPPLDYRFIQERVSLPVPADSPSSSFASQSRRVPQYIRQMPVSAQVHYGEGHPHVRSGNHAHRNHSRRMPYYQGHEGQSPRRQYHHPSAGLKQHYCRVPRPTPETSFDGNLPY